MVPSDRTFQEARPQRGSRAPRRDHMLQREMRMEPDIPNAPSISPSQSLPPPAAAPGWPRAPRSLDAGRGAAWWGEGWRVFTASPALWIGIIVVMVVIAIVLNYIWIIGNVAQALLWPVFIGGVLLGCHALAVGRPL